MFELLGSVRGDVRKIVAELVCGRAANRPPAAWRHRRATAHGVHRQPALTIHAREGTNSEDEVYLGDAGEVLASMALPGTPVRLTDGGESNHTPSSR